MIRQSKFNTDYKTLIVWSALAGPFLRISNWGSSEIVRRRCNVGKGVLSHCGGIWEMPLPRIKSKFGGYDIKRRRS